MPLNNKKRSAHANASGQGSQKRQALSNVSCGPAINGQFLISKTFIKEEKPSVAADTTLSEKEHSSKAKAAQPPLRSVSLGAVTTVSKLGSHNTHEPFESLGSAGKKYRRYALAWIQKHFPQKILTTDAFFRLQNQPNRLPKYPLDLCTPYLANFGDFFFRIGGSLDEVEKALQTAAKRLTGTVDGTLAAEDIKEAEVQWRLKEEKATAREAARLDEQKKSTIDRQKTKETIRQLQQRLIGLEKERDDLKRKVSGYELSGARIKLEEGLVPNV